MRCSKARAELDRYPDRVSAALAEHLAGCAPCARLTARLTGLRASFPARRVDLQPDAGFAARVVARIEEPAELLGWAALRMLPAALALVVLLGVLVRGLPAAAETGSKRADEVESEAGSDDVLVWLAEFPAGDEEAEN